MKRVLKTLMIALLVGSVLTTGIDKGLDLLLEKLMIVVDNPPGITPPGGGNGGGNGGGSTNPGGTTNPGGGTTDPNGGTTDPNGGTTDPNGGTTDPNGGTTDPNGGTTDPNGGTTDPNGGTTDPNGGTTDPNGGTTDPNGGDTNPDGNTLDTDTDSIIAKYSNIKDLPWERYFYFRQLSTKTEQESYCALLSKMYNLENQCNMSNIDADRFYAIFQLVLGDHPELFWINNTVSRWNTSDGSALRWEMNQQAGQIPQTRQKIEAAAADCLDKMQNSSMTDFEKINYAVDYISAHTKYVLNSPEDQNIQSVFLYHNSVCSGYAKALEYLIGECGIENFHVTGDAGGAHAWTMVKLDGEYYWVDATWADQDLGEQISGIIGDYVNYDYLCDTTKEFMSIRTVRDYYKDYIPQAVSVKYNYYNMKGWYYDSFNKAAMVKDSMAMIDSGRKVVGFKFSNENAYKACYKDIYNGGELFREIRKAFDKKIPDGEIYLFHDDDFMTVKVGCFPKR